MNLRPYQIEALAAVQNRSVQRGIVALPTGCGKSVVASELPNVLGTRRLLYMAHREELINQMAEHCERVVGYWDVDIEQGDRHANAAASIVVASVPTLVARDCRRLKLLGQNRFDGVIIDECHHATADSYLKIMQHFGMLDEDRHKTTNCQIPLIGLTATPGRGDKVGLVNVFDDILYQLKIARAIKDGWLVPIRAWTVETGVDISDVGTRQGDFAENELAEAVNTDHRNDVVLDACRKYADGKKTLIFCVDISHAIAMADFFHHEGLEARAVYGTMGQDERRAVMDWFDKTPGAILTNCQIVTEGVDIPSVECVVMARPTKSSTLYAQMMGRGTRLARGSYDYTESVKLGKSECILLDITDSIHDAGKRAVNICDIFGAPLPTKKIDGQNIVEEVEEQERAVRAEKERVEIETEQMETRRREAIARSVDLFAGSVDIPGSTCQWTGSDSLIRLSLGKHGLITASPDLMDRWTGTIFDHETNREMDLGIVGNTQEEFVRLAEEYVNRTYPNSSYLINKNSGWRHDPPSEKQVSLCQKLGIGIPDGVTKGQVSIALDNFFNRKNRQKVVSNE
jgi:ATP-dependent helicase IRC3